MSNPEKKGRYPANVIIGEGVGLGDKARFYYCAKASPKERAGNGHPCCKPLAICTWLATLILPPPRATPRKILIPYAGSGSEVLGAIAAGFDEVVGIEREKEYCDVARKRLAMNGRVPLHPIFSHVQ
jgi:DNA modification methylase